MNKYEQWLQDNQFNIQRALEEACLSWVNQQAIAYEHDAVETLEETEQGKFVSLLKNGKKSISKVGYHFSKKDVFLYIVTLNHYVNGKQTFNTGETLKGLWNKGNPNLTNIKVTSKPLVKPIDENKIKREQQAKHNAFERDLKVWESLPLVGESEYLNNKQISQLPEGLVKYGKDFILVALKDWHKNIIGFQKIFNNGKKSYTYGLSKNENAAFISIRGNLEQFVICEGFATGASIYLATGFTVLCAGDASNLGNVAKSLHDYLNGKTATVFIASDNDLRKETDKCQINTGLVAAEKVAQQFNFKLIVPQLNGQKCDFNDLHINQGLDVVTKAFENKKKTNVVPIKVNEASNDTNVETVIYPLDEPLDVNLFKHLKNGKPLATLENLKIVLKHYGFEIRFNQITKRDVVSFNGNLFDGSDADNIALSKITSVCIINGMSVTHLPIYLLDIAHENAFNPVKEWIESKPWDGESRLGDLEDTIEKSPDISDDLFKLLLRKWLISAVAAAYNCHGKFRSKGVIVFQGKQSLGKTAWFKRLVPQELKVIKDGVNLDVSNKDSVLKVISHWIVELGELDATFKKSEIAQLKAFITEDSDIVRRPYAKKDSYFTRQTVFCGSVNDQDFLKDTTGNVRFWTIPVTYLDYEHGIDMQQLWAEIATFYLKGEKWWLTKEQENQLEENNALFVEENRFADKVSHIFNYNTDKSYKLKTDEALKLIGIHNPTKQDIREMNQQLTKMFGEKKKNNTDRYFLSHWVIKDNYD